ncbi:MAG TPA: CoA pyrophosphatase [Streptosporangiaceae bacterium]|nr:CoA pyrophosphatase [Streptosporangiaceae bacterium]
MTSAPGATVPGWLADLAREAAQISVPPRMRPPADVGRPSAVLLLFGESEGQADLLIAQRSPWLRRHAGQAAFPGGAVEPADSGPVGAALREAAEEVGVDPSGVEVLAVLPELFIPPTGFRVTPVIGWWRQPTEVQASPDGEVVAATRVALADLADPANRLSVRHPSGFTGAAFRVHGMLVWGFTAMLVEQMLVLGGWERPWQREHVEDLPPEALGPITRD